MEWPTRCTSFQFQCFKGLCDSFCRNPSVTDLGPIQRFAVTGQIKRQRAFAAGKTSLNVHPGLAVAAKAVQQDDRRAVISGLADLFAKGQGRAGIWAKVCHGYPFGIKKLRSGVWCAGNGQRFK
jgi:uncharacterized Zn finger protein